jgi:hypothetical protein
MNAEVAVPEAEVETATEAEAEVEAANTEGQIISVNSGRIVRAEGNRCGSLQLASSIKNPYELSIHFSKSSVAGGSCKGNLADSRRILHLSLAKGNPKRTL